MDYLIKSAQQHESFRRPELEALAALARIDLKIVEYDPEVRMPRQKVVVLTYDSHHTASCNWNQTRWHED